MKYIIYKDPISEDQDGIISKLLSKILPQGNPDFNDIYIDVKKWLLEINESNGSIEREIGINKNGKIIAIGPWGKNYGLWTDSPVLIDNPNDFEQISEKVFNDKWTKYIQKNSTAV